MKTYKKGSTEVIDVAYAAAIELNPTETETIVNIGELTGNVALTIGAGAAVQPGARLIIKGKSDGTARSMTFGAGFTAVAVAGAINKTKVQEFYFDGTSFKAVAAPVQID